MTTLITSAEYQTLTNETITGGDLPDAYVDAVLEAVSLDAQRWLGENLGPATYTDEAAEAQAVTYNGQPCLRVTVLHTPITAVSALSVWYAVDKDPTSLSVDDAVIEEGKSAFLVPFGTFGLWQTFFRLSDTYRAQVTYTAGEAVPQDVKLAVALLAQEMFAMQAETSSQGADSVEQWKIGEYSEKKVARDLNASEGLGLGTQLSVRAAQILRRHKAMGVTFV